MVHGVLREFLAEQTRLGRLKPGLELTRVAILFHDMIVFDLLNRALAGLTDRSRQNELAATVADAIRLITPGLLPRKE